MKYKIIVSVSITILWVIILLQSSAIKNIRKKINKYSQISDLTKQYIRRSSDAKQTITGLKSRQIDQNNVINDKFENTSLQMKSEPEEIIFNIDFGPGGSAGSSDHIDTFEVDLRKQSKQLNREAQAMEAQILWCSQYDTAYLMIGSELPDFRPASPTSAAHNLYDFEDPAQLQGSDLNEYVFMTKPKSAQCLTSTEVIQFEHDSFKLKSAGDHHCVKKQHSTSTPKMLSTIKLVVKGWYIKFNKLNLNNRDSS